MVQPTLPLRRPSRTDIALDLLRARPGEWIDARVFMQSCGQMAWRTRIADARRIVKREGGDVENRQRRHDAGWVISEYRLVPGEGAA